MSPTKKTTHKRTPGRGLSFFARTSNRAGYAIVQFQSLNQTWSTGHHENTRSIP